MEEGKRKSHNRVPPAKENTLTAPYKAKSAKKKGEGERGKKEKRKEKW